MPTPAADDFAAIWQRQCAIREAADNARNAAGCAYAEDRPQSECTVCNNPQSECTVCNNPQSECTVCNNPQSECTVCNNPQIQCTGCVRKRNPGAAVTNCPICSHRPAHSCPER